MEIHVIHQVNLKKKCPIFLISKKKKNWRNEIEIHRGDGDRQKKCMSEPTQFRKLIGTVIAKVLHWDLSWLFCLDIIFV